MADWKQASACWNAFDRSTPFQSPQWYEAWYDAFANAEGVEPLIAGAQRRMHLIELGEERRRRRLARRCDEIALLRGKEIADRPWYFWTNLDVSLRPKPAL